jgi:predicted Zn-dependent protease
LRWDRADGTYTIAAGERRWDVNEQANQAKVTKAAFFVPAEKSTGIASGTQGTGVAGGTQADAKVRLDVMALLELPAEIDRNALAAATPAEQIERAGEKLDVYRWNVRAAGGVPLVIEAFVHTDSRMLSSIAAQEINLSGPFRERAKLSVISANKPIDDSLFVVGETLTDDGRVGKVADVQGIVTLKPVMRQRWTPVVTHALVKPGDWVRTDVRGANAVALRLVKNTLVTLGPGSLVEVQKPNRLRLSSGEIKIVAETGAAVELLGPGNEKVSVAGTGIYRLQNEKLVKLEKAPLWLAGFEGTTNNESLGSLLAKVDGRVVPLTVGYHKVTVDIRDQIARTVVEESFVNHTNERLEGVFYFPLPQDASISGFGMWIGNELVEADVVEKQRAREIYETILREKRDPGLLEWTGGNIFKARVFPIEPHSEKRIKISYTQVLPLVGKSYRYSYGLRSELLKQNPLRELAIDVKLNSTQALSSVHSPTHTTARVDNTAHSAHVEFAAQEYTPKRDFEIVVELADNQPNIVLIPHRRGDDGYFMLMLTPPDGAGQWQRDVLPDGNPLNLLILADTSASMDAPSRAAQGEFIASLLASLGPADKFNLGACDVDASWVFLEPVAADETHVEAARKFLADRVSLGWTDLDKAFESALKQTGEPASAGGNATQIVYVGDGIVTTKDADPAVFAKRLALLCQGKRAALHAVSVSSSFEPMVLKAIASEGGGSLRQVSGERTPQSVALELLGEISRPTLRNLKIEFNGIRTARVYPEELPNLAAGSQQIVLGRYLPAGVEQKGEVVVSGMQGDEAVRFRTAVTLPNVVTGVSPVSARPGETPGPTAEDVSFIPRLWARMHLDALLAQGSSQAIQDDIINLSEEFHIITPYTSLLVLESDADRERFGVKRRFQMRDAERFFAEGRDNANYELLAQQMKRAGTWRLGLRQQVLAQLAGLGRNPNVFNPPQARGEGRMAGVWESRERDASIWYEINAGSFDGGSFGGGGYPGRAGGQPSINNRMREFKGLERGGAAFGNGSMNGGDLDLDGFLGDWLVAYNRDESTHGLVATNGQPFSGGFGLSMSLSAFVDEDRLGAEFNIPIGGGSVNYEVNGRRAYNMPALATSGPMAMEQIGMGFAERESDVGRMLSPMSLGYGWSDEAYRAKLKSYPGRKDRYVDYGYQYTSWLDGLFPALAEAPGEEAPFEPKKPWPAEIRAVLAGLMRTEQLAALPGGLRIERHNEGFDTRWNELTSRGDGLELVSPSAWLTRSGGFGSQTTVQWCDQEERGVYGEAFWLGRRRTSSPRELARPPLGLPGHVLTSLERSYPNYDAKLEPQGGERTRLTLSVDTNPGYEIWITIDTARKVILSIEYRQDGVVQSQVEYDEFVEVAGAWYAGRTQSFDKDGRRNSVTADKFTLLDAGAFGQQMAQQLAGRERVQFLKLPLPSVVAAKRNLEDNKATFEDRIVLLLLDCGNQQWDSALAHLAEAEKLAGDKPGLRWIRNSMLNISRRREELRTRIMSDADDVTQLRVPPQPNVQPESLFLATHLINQATGIFENNEMLSLLDALKPTYERQPPHLAALKSWLQHRLNFLNSANRNTEALAVQKQLAEKWPHDASEQVRYADALANQGQWTAGYAWLDRVNVAEAKWYPWEDEMLRAMYADLLNRQGRWTDMTAYLERWVALNPETGSAYERYLAALLKTDRLDDMNALIAKWLEEGRQAGKLPPAAALRFQAAIHRALGRGHDIQTNRLDERWLDPLALAVRAVFRNERSVAYADQIMGDGHFQASDPCRQLRREFLAILQEELASLKQPQLHRLVNWVLPNDPAIEAGVWRQIAARLAERWAATADADEKHQLGATIVQINTRLNVDEQLAFLRRQLSEGPEKYRAQYAAQLFNSVLAQAWTAEFEDEAFGLLDRMSDAKTQAAKLADELRALHQLTDRMVQARYNALMAKIEHREELTRIELRDKQAENLKAAREGFAARLDKARAGRGDPLGKWFLIERLYLDVQLGRNLDRVADECWELLGPVATGVSPVDGKAGGTPVENKADETSAATAAYLDAVLRQRMLVTLTNLAARKDARPELIAKLLDYVDKALAAAGAENVSWKSFKYQLLIALDRPKDLEAGLRDWLRADDPLAHWRIALANVLAEQGKLAEAVPLLEAVEKDKQLGPAEYRTLADWYMVLNQRDKHEAALSSVMTFTQEWQLSNWLWGQLAPWRNNSNNQPMPTELDPNVLRAFSVLFDKSASPQSYASQLREFYRATHDFRLIAGLANSVVGHTAGRVYPFLGGLDQVFGEVREEATVDSLHDEIEKVRGRMDGDASRGAAPPLAPPQGGERNGTNVDLRALDLLDAIIERRAAEVLNQPGPHAEKAVAALRRAFARQWTPGEERLMADLLANMGKIAQADLAAEQVRELEELHKRFAPGTQDRLHIGHALARSYWNYSRQTDAIDLLEVSLAEYRAAHDGVLPGEANGALDTFISYLEATSHHARGESVLVEEIEHPIHPPQTYWLRERLYRLYRSAIESDGTVSLGSGPQMYRAVQRQLQNDLDTPDANHRRNLINVLCEIYRAASAKRMDTVREDLRGFAFDRLPAVLRMQTNDYQGLVQTVGQTMRDLLSPRDGVELLVACIEREPSWFRFNNQDGWSRFGHQLAEWRFKADGEQPPAIDRPLAERLLAIVVAELRRDLESRTQHNRIMYAAHNTHYWAAKRADFLRAAEAVYAERKSSGEAVKYIAEYLYHGIDAQPRAIEILLVAHGQKLLDEGGQSQLVNYLQGQGRYGESIAILQPLVEQRPDNIEYRTRLMRAYHQTGRRDELLALLKATDAYFHEKGRWGEGPLAALAYSCLENSLFEQSVAYYEELIPLHQRTQPNRGIGNGTLSNYYRYLSGAHAGLKNTLKAVDAACGAIVSWGNNMDNRAEAVRALQRVLEQSPDLDGFITAMDKQVEESGLENPIVRKAAGRVFFNRNQFAKAIKQLELARQAQPNDAETHKLLVECYDRENDQRGAVRQLLASIELSRRDLALYKDLARRYQALEQSAQAERANTAIVEMQPNESESHAMLAEIRQGQGRWSDAIDQWRRVSEIRKLEPTGLVKLAEAEIHERRWDAAEKTLQQLEAKRWPERFGDIPAQARHLHRQIDDGRKL